MIDISKMVDDGKQSGSARAAFVFYVQNIANLVRATPEGTTDVELADMLHSRAEDMAAVVFDHHFATAPAAPVAPIAQESQEAVMGQPNAPAIEDGHPVAINPPAEPYPAGASTGTAPMFSEPVEPA